MQPLLVSLLAAAEAAPTDVTLRLHVVELLREHGELTEAIRHCAAALSVEPTAEPARVMMRELLDGAGGQGSAAPPRAAHTPRPGSHHGGAEAQTSTAPTGAEPPASTTATGTDRPGEPHGHAPAPSLAAAYGVPAPERTTRPDPTPDSPREDTRGG